MSGLWVPPSGVALLKMRPSEKTVTLPSGERARITVDDSGTVKHRETANRLDAKVSPSNIRVKVTPEQGALLLEALRLTGAKVNVRR
jgi:hypothetical protein